MTDERRVERLEEGHRDFAEMLAEFANRLAQVEGRLGSDAHAIAEVKDDLRYVRNRVHDLVEKFFTPLGDRVTTVEVMVKQLSRLTDVVEAHSHLITQQGNLVATMTAVVARIEKLFYGMIAVVGTSVITAILGMAFKLSRP